jgi:hypothetical protein
VLHRQNTGASAQWSWSDTRLGIGLLRRRAEESELIQDEVTHQGVLAMEAVTSFVTSPCTRNNKTAAA